jgi:hypothetical protein
MIIGFSVVGAGLVVMGGPHGPSPYVWLGLAAGISDLGMVGEDLFAGPVPFRR